MRFAANASLALIVLLAGIVGGMSAFNMDATWNEVEKVCETPAFENVCEENSHNYEWDACYRDVVVHEPPPLLVDGRCCSLQGA